MRVSDSINISRAYEQINALGGYVDPKDPIAVARDEVLADVLAILECHGARDTLNDGLMDAESEAALDAVISAERHRLTVALLITRGSATRYAFPRHDADTAIQSSVSKVTESRFAMDRLVASRALGERCKAAPTTGLQCASLQDRVTANEAQSNILAIGLAMTAAHRVDGADRAHVLRAHRVGAGIPSPSDFQPSCHSPMAG